MKTTTINISLPKKMYEDAKKVQDSQRYTSISELIRDSLRKTLYEEITENGFTRKFEDATLESAKEPIDESNVWKTEKDVHQYFRGLRKRVEKRKDGKS